MLFDPYHCFTPQDFVFKIARSQLELEGYWALRRAIFCEEQAIFHDSDRDTVDDRAIPIVCESLLAAMGGTPLAVVDRLWTPSLPASVEIWDGMTAASRAYGVPIVGGHTTVTGSGNAFLAAAVLGKARKLITSFDARPNHDLLMAAVITLPIKSSSRLEAIKSKPYQELPNASQQILGKCIRPNTKIRCHCRWVACWW
jgi:thiamine monophosphate kinase